MFQPAKKTILEVLINTSLFLNFQRRQSTFEPDQNVKVQGSSVLGLNYAVIVLDTAKYTAFAIPLETEEYIGELVDHELKKLSSGDRISCQRSCTVQSGKSRVGPAEESLKVNVPTSEIRAQRVVSVCR